MESKIITEPGRYPSPDKKYNLLVTTDSSHIVNYEIISAGPSISLRKGKVGSAFHKYFLMWDDNNNIWIDAEDVNQVIFFEKGEFRPHNKTTADYKDPNFPKPPVEWNGPAHR